VARLETDADAALRYRARLRPWLAGAMDDIVTITSEIVTGFQLLPSQPGAGTVQAAF
jgi:hypothetical protein